MKKVGLFLLALAVILSPVLFSPKVVSASSLAVSNYSFSPNTITLGQATTASFTMTGGTAGTYTVQFWKSDIFPTLQGSATFSYNGTSLTENQPFTPILTGPYYMQLVLNGSTVWKAPTNGLTVSAVPTFAVSIYGFSPGSITPGQSSSGSVGVTGGSAGTYTLAFWQDINLGSDVNVGRFTFQYNGSSATFTHAITPTVAGSYHMSIELNGSTVWSQPTGTSRLAVAVAAPSVSSYSFSPSMITLGQATTASFTMTGGTAGTYTVQFWKSDIFPTLQGSATFSYNGTSLTENQPFTPILTGPYYMQLVLNGSTVWKAPTNGLTVSAVPTFAVSIYGFSPGSITPGQSSSGSVGVTGGSAGTYTLAFWQDINLGSDVNVGRFTFQYNGSSATFTHAITPTVAGSYHMSIELNGSTVWSQPTGTSRLAVAVAAPSVSSYSFSPSMITLGQATTASFTMTGGTAGTYTVQFWKSDIFPTLQGSATFSYNGTSLTETQPFTPILTGPYYMVLVLNGSTVWTEPANGLTVSAVPTFAVSIYGFSPGSITPGQSSSGSVGVTGGGAGTYTLAFWQDINLGSDVNVGRFTFQYNGSSATFTHAITPTVAGSYHMSIELNGSTVWSQPTGTSRLAVAVAAPSVSSYSFSPSMITLGQATTASFTMTGGTAGTYTVQFWKSDIFPTLQGSATFSYNGTSLTETQPFTPILTGPYYMVLVLNGSTVWTEPANGLTVSAVPTFAVSIYGFSPGSITPGQSSSGSVGVTGGSAGTYTLAFWQDINLGSDVNVGRFTFQYNGSSATFTHAITPTVAGSYHMSIELNGSTVWSQSTGTSRLAVATSTSTATTLAIASYSFSQGTITVGQSSTGSVVITGGSAGTYTLAFWQDVNFGFDTNIGRYTFQHNGISTTLSKSITPTAAGTYHMSLEFNTSTIWSQPNGSSRLTVSPPPLNVKIESIDIPASVILGQIYYYDVVIRNNGVAQATVTLNIDSSSTGHVSTSSFTLPANTDQPIPITADFTSTGVRTLTYTVASSGQILDSLIKTVDATMAPPSSANAWRQNIQPGDILLVRSTGFFADVISLTGDFWTHAGIYLGNGLVGEATGSGVAITPITSWDSSSKTCVGLFRVHGVDAAMINKVINFVQSQVGKPYKMPFFSSGPLKNSSPDAPDWYCSELVWAAYIQVGINIEDTPDGGLVSPQEIGFGPNIDQIAIHAESIPTLLTSGSQYFSVELHSPADLIVTDPNGLVVSSKASQIPGAEYFVDDFDHNSGLETIVYIPGSKTGGYQVKVVPWNSATVTDRYSVQTEVSGQSSWLATDALISDIPTQGYATIVGIPASLTTESATNVGSDKVQLNGNLTSLGSGSSVSVSFQWGTDSGKYTAETPMQTMTAAGAFTSSIGNLSSNTVYYFRAKVEVSLAGGGINVPSSAYVSYGPENSFSTSVNTKQPTAIETTPATPGTSLGLNQTNEPMFLIGIILVVGAIGVIGIVYLSTRRKRTP